MRPRSLHPGRLSAGGLVPLALSLLVLAGGDPASAGPAPGEVLEVRTEVHLLFGWVGIGSSRFEVLEPEAGTPGRRLLRATHEISRFRKGRIVEDILTDGPGMAFVSSRVQFFDTSGRRTGELTMQLDPESGELIRACGDDVRRLAMVPDAELTTASLLPYQIRARGIRAGETFRFAFVGRPDRAGQLTGRDADGTRFDLAVGGTTGFFDLEPGADRRPAGGRFEVEPQPGMLFPALTVRVTPQVSRSARSR